MSHTEPRFGLGPWSRSGALVVALLTPGAGCLALDVSELDDPGLLAPGDPDDPDDHLAVASSSHELAGSGILVEPTHDSAGAFPEVMSYSGACTGTVVGPYAVLTAHHCPSGSAVQWPGTGASLAIASSISSPYVSAAYWPRWWRALNTQQIQAGGRTDDWPAQHDLRVAFVPGLTPAWIAAHLRDSDVGPARIDPYAVSSSSWAVGVCSKGCGDRDFQSVQYAPSVPDNITQKNRDGYFNYADSWYFDDLEPGDSGGPALGGYTTYWPAAGGAVSGPRHVVSTHQGSGGGGYSDAGHNAPLAYNINVPLTPNQRYTVRLNHLWASAVISDADRDRLPLECDSDPANPVGSSNLCPSAMGSADITAPRGLLQCKAGHVATGVRGRAGWLIDELAVRCTPTSCLRAGGSCAAEYWTDPFAGESGGGGPFTRTCAAGRAISYLRGRHSSGSQLNELHLWCNDYAPLVDSGWFSGGQDLGRVGNDFGALGYGIDVPWQSCANRGVLTGFEARSNLQGNSSLFWLTGVQPICSGSIRESAFQGSTSGGFTDLACPANHIGVGFVAAAYALDPDYVGLTGLLCMDRSELGAAPSDDRLVVAHGSYHLHPAVYPAKVERYLTFKSRHGLGSSYRERKCPAGQSVRSAEMSSGGTFISHFGGFTCASPAGSTTWVGVGVGTPGATSRVLSCPDPQTERAAGLRLHSGWLTDGAALMCRPS